MLAAYLAWEADGSGISHYDAVDRPRGGASSETGLVVVEQPYTALAPSFHALRPGRALTGRASWEPVDQDAYYDAWVSLGSFSFTGAGGDTSSSPTRPASRTRRNACSASTP